MMMLRWMPVTMTMIGEVGGVLLGWLVVPMYTLSVQSMEVLVPSVARLIRTSRSIMKEK